MRNLKRSFDANICNLLGEYVYALQDPRDRQIFYVGKGTDNRVFAHFDETDDAVKGQKSWTNKRRRICQIWEAGLDVRYWILRRALTPGADPIDAFDVEAAAIDVLAISQNGRPDNDQAGHHGEKRGILSEEQIRDLESPLVNPSGPLNCVFVFPIQQGLARGVDVYEATRQWWRVGESYQMLEHAIAVGVESNIVRGAFSIDNWNPHLKEPRKAQFVGTQINEPQLDGKNFAKVIAMAMGYWQRGNFLIVAFDGHGNFKILRGLKMVEGVGHWHPCAQ